jgi:hypothetical protein
MIVADLRKALKGVRGNLEVYTRDHDHGKYETNGLARCGEVINQKEMNNWEREHLDDIFKIDKKYFVVSA